MVTEAYCDFETAKLLKEKGFNEKCFRTYFNDGIISRIFDDNDEIYNENLIPSVVAAPTLQMAMKWLRVNYNIHIEPRYFPMPNIYRYVIIHSPTTIENIDSHPQYFNTYEETCDAAIKYCIENLI